MRLEEACEDVFARHETFHPKLGWFRKAVLAAPQNHGGLFLADDAPVRLGVGKNMVRSIRFWGTAARLICDVPHPSNSRLNHTAPTNLGVGVLGGDGLDPFMDDPGTWWWLHWMMLAPTSILPVWWLLFNEFDVIEFDEQLAERVCVASISAAGWEMPQVSSVHKDVTALLRTYGDGLSQRGKFDDQFGSPLRDLRLLSTTPGGYRFSSGLGVPPAILLAAILDHAAVTGTTARTAMLARVATDSGSPAKAFRLHEDQLGELLAPIISTIPSVELTVPAGAAQLAWKEEPGVLAHRILCDYYGKEVDRPTVAGPAARGANLDGEAALQLAQLAVGVVL